MKTQQKIFLIVTLFWLAERAASQEFIGPHGYLTLEAEISTKDSVGQHGTFDLHHFNIFGDYLLNAKARVFGEIEFEHGTDTEYNDYAGGEAGIVRVERAWFEYAFADYLKLRLGKFLTPYGIYNEIHDAAPAYDTSILPESIYGIHENPFGQRQRFYSKFSIGVQVLGRFEMASSQLQYQFMLANGRGRQPFEQDDNKDKALGVRFTAELPTTGLKLGYSLYTEKNGLAHHTRQTSHAADLRFEFKRWRWSSEVAHTTLGAAQSALASYIELAYHLFDRQTLLIRYDVFDPNRGRRTDRERDLTIGANLQVLRQVLVKAETHLWQLEQEPRRHYTLAIASLAVVF